MRLSDPPLLPTLAARCKRLLRPPYPVVSGSVCGLVIMALLAGFVPGRRSSELRMPVGLYAPDMLFGAADRRPLDTTTWMVRRPISRQSAPYLAGSDAGDADGLIGFSSGGVSILTASGPRRVRPSLAEAAVEGTARPDDLFQLLHRQGQGLPFGLSLTPTAMISGKPAALCVAPPGSESARNEAVRRAWRAGGAPYSATVDMFTEKFGLDRRLVYAIMYTESGFDPSSISNRDAHGLMQIVPGGAGDEVHKYLHGTSGQPDAATLLNPVTNIQYGVTYLHLLMQRHMSGVRDPLSREYCAVAAYNIGPNAVLKVFGASREEAFAAINAFTPIELYAALIERLPASETRAFLRKVMLTKSGLAAAAE